MIGETILVAQFGPWASGEGLISRKAAIELVGLVGKETEFSDFRLAVLVRSVSRATMGTFAGMISMELVV